jgi:hypothetical protein
LALSDHEAVRDTDNWLYEMNQLADIGSQKAVKSYPETKKQEIRAARETFYGHLPALKVALEKSSKSQLRLKPAGFVAVSRVLFSHNVDIQTVAENFPQILFHTGENLRDTLELLESFGIKSAAVNKFPRILTLSTETIPDKMQALSESGLQPGRIINIHPSISLLSPKTIADRKLFYELNGLDFVELMSGNPRILTFSPIKVKSKLNVLYAAAKSWEIEGYQDRVNRVVEKWPTVLTYSKTKLQVLSRIASYSLDDFPPEEITMSNITNSVQSNLEAVIAGYLNNEISRPQDIYRISAKYKKLGDAALKDIVASHTEDPIVKVYLRGYKL